ILLRCVALRADGIGGSAKLRAVRLVAIAAGDAGREHLALLERAVVVDLVAHLSVGLVQPARERRDGVGVGEPAAGRPIPGEFAAARVAEAAGLDLLAHQRRGEVARGISRVAVDAPEDVAPFVEASEQALLRVFILAERPPAPLLVHPRDVARALAVTGLAADADLRPRARESVGRRFVILAHAGRVASGAHEIPVLVQLGPMQDVVVLDLFVRIEVEPALAAGLLWAAVPGDR